MTSTPLTGNSSPAAAIGGTGTSSGKSKALNANDFINLMVTQLQHQDPTQPESNDQLLSQMSQIAQLQSSTTMQTSLSSMVLQSQIGSAGNLIGKNIEGLDDQQNNVKGAVTSVRVQDSQVYLQLDNGHQVAMANVTSITPPATTPAKAA